MPYISLSINSISKFQDGLNKILDYQNDIDRKMDLALERLVAEGITICYANSSVWDYVDDSINSINNMIFFREEDIAKLRGYSEVALVGQDLGKIISRWRYRGGIKEAEVSPLLMAEFGSGKFAESTATQHENQVDGVGQGTFPGQKHAFEPEWIWVDADTNIVHRSKGIMPTYPMLNGRNHMMLRVATVFREVFQ